MTGVQDKECVAPRRPLHRKADPISFAFFVGLLVAVLLVPAAALRKRDDAPHE